MDYKDAVNRKICHEIIKQLEGQPLDEAREILEDLLAVQNYEEPEN